MPLLDQLLNSHGEVILDSLARHLELSRDEAERVFSRTVPLVLGGLARQSETKGPDAVARILADHSDQTALTDSVAYFDRQAQSKDPLGGLGSLLGGGGLLGGPLASLFAGSIANLATNALGSYLEIDPSRAAKVLPMLAPLVMASLHRLAGEDGSPGLAAVLQVLAEEGDVGALQQLAGKVLGG